MKTQILIASTIALIGMESAYSNCSQALPSTEQCTAIPEPAQNIAHCKNYTFPYSLCYTNNKGTYKKFHICSTCEDGYILTLNSEFTAMGCDLGDGGVYTCQPCSVAKTCDPSSEIAYSPDSWYDSWVGYQSNSWTECNTGTCTWETRTKYRCAAGYYGISSAIKENYIEGFGVMGLSGCTRCPINSMASKYGESDLGNNDTIQNCYLVESESYDVSGHYTIVPPNSRCYYE